MPIAASSSRREGRRVGRWAAVRRRPTARDDGNAASIRESAEARDGGHKLGGGESRLRITDAGRRPSASSTDGVMSFTSAALRVVAL